MSSLISAEVTATCNALGFNDEIIYNLDPYCKESIRDLIRYLRRDSENHEIRRQLGSSKVLEKDLIPILCQHSSNEELFDLNLRLLINLMSPVILLYKEELPSEKVSRNYYLQLLSQLQSAKAAFADEKIWKVLADKMGTILKLEWADRGEEKGFIIERILILARNVLHVPANSNEEKRPDSDASIHDQVLWAMHTSGLIDLFVYLASSENETQYYLHILEIISLILREQTPEFLANVSASRSAEEKVKDNAALLVVRQKEIEEKAEKMRKYAGARHSRFGGTFVVKGIKSIGDRDMVVHKAPKEITQLTFDQHKVQPKTPKNRLPMQDTQEVRKSAYSIRLFLKEFCVEFLNGAYNPFMFAVREKISRGKAQPNDESYYFWALAFFMEFNRLYKFQVKLVSETLSVHIFHFVQSQLETWMEMMITDKKKIPVWSKRMHLALKAYKELLMTLAEMDRSSDEGVRASAKSIKSNLFYVSDYRDLIFVLFTKFTPLKFTRSYLIDLVETAHIFMKHLEAYCKNTHHMVVQTSKKTGKKKKKKKSKKGAGAAAKKASARDLEMVWEMVGPEVSALLQNEDLIPRDVVPFDATLEMSMGEQKVEAMKKVRSLLKNGDVDQAVGLLRAAREVWPENDCFGNDDMDSSEELLAIREIFMTDIGEMTVAPDPDSDDSDDSSGIDDEERDEGMDVSEQNFSFIDFVRRFARPTSIQACCTLLEQFEKNSVATNHQLVKLLHRITFDCKLPALIFQASVFRTFQRILNSKNPTHKELQKFAVYIIRRFTEISKTNKLVFMELLFWKTEKTAFEMEAGYGQEAPQRGSQNRFWTEEQEHELRVLFEEYERDKPEGDMVDWIMKNLINKERTRRNVIKKLKELGLKATKVPKPRKSKPKTKNQKAQEDLLNDNSDSDSKSDASDAEGSQNERAPFKSGPAPLNTGMFDTSDSDSDPGVLNDDNGDIFPGTLPSHRSSMRSDSDSDDDAVGRKVTSPTQNSQRTASDFSATQNSQRSNNSDMDEETFFRSLNSNAVDSQARAENPLPVSDKSDDENSESFFLSNASSFKSGQSQSKGTSKVLTDSEDSQARAETSLPVSDKSDDENSESFFLSNASSFKSGQSQSKGTSKVLTDSEDESKTPTKSPLKVISNSNKFSTSNFVASDSDEDSGNLQPIASAKKSASRKRLRKAASSDEENHETPTITASPKSAFSSDKKRARQVLSSDSDSEKTPKPHCSPPSSRKESSKKVFSSDEEETYLPKSQSSSITANKRSRRVLSSDEEDSEVQDGKGRTSRKEEQSITINSSDDETPLISKSKAAERQNGGTIEIHSSDSETCSFIKNKTSSSLSPAIEINSSDDETFTSPKSKVPAHRSDNTPKRGIKVRSGSASKITPNSKTLPEASSNTPGSRMSLYLNSDSNDSPARIFSRPDSDTNNTPAKMVLHLNSDSNDTPSAKLSLHLDSDSNQSPLKLNSSSFNTVNKTRKLQIDSDSD
nr:PREDICTED: protein timeless homolog [Bemisia tabaci]